MAKFLTAALIIISLGTKAQEKMTFLRVDSITGQCYLNSDWDKLISIGKKAIDQNIDYKKLRQRIGYAYFQKADYTAALINYEYALKFDQYDYDTQAFLYYCGLNTGEEQYTRYYAAKLPEKLKKSEGIKQFKPVSQVDLEYNIKITNSDTRSNPTYTRLGLATQLGYRFELHQFVSTYGQTIDGIQIQQPEYYALLRSTLTSHLYLDVAYHYLNYRIDGVGNPGNLFFSGVSAKINRFGLGVNGSLFNNGTQNINQLGLWGGVTLPGKSTIYLKSSLNGLKNATDTRLIYSQTAGAHIYKSVWAEGNVTTGNLKNYNELNAYYIYNSYDPTEFRTGLTIFWYVRKNITLMFNFMNERKLIESTAVNYNQQSFSGAITWKL